MVTVTWYSSTLDGIDLVSEIHDAEAKADGERGGMERIFGPPGSVGFLS